MAVKGTELVPASTKQAIAKHFDRGLELLRAEAVESVRTGRIGVARTRFKEGFTTKDQFLEELRLLRVSDEELELELASAELDYATDYLKDLITAYRDALRAGNIDMDLYRELLLQLGLVPERVEGYVLKEKARLKPGELPTPVALPAPYYETEAGKIIVDTIRRKRRKVLITRDQEISSFLELGVPIELATAHADNDDVRLAEKGGEE